MGKKIVEISDALFAPFDEGKKNIAYSLHNHMEENEKIVSATITSAGYNTGDLNVTKIALNKLFINSKLQSFLKAFSPDIIFYVPYSSYTFNSFVRARVLKFMAPSSKIIIFGTRYIHLTDMQIGIIESFLKPDLLLLLGKSGMDVFLKKGLKVKVVPPAVDTVKFCPASEEEKKMIRRKYNLSNDKVIALHVGHINKNRNIDSLLDIQKLEGAQVVIVGSTTTEIEHNIKFDLEKQGVRVINEFIPDISIMYKMADIYVFPVASSGNSVGAIEMPLSVIEAMSCNLPVITTRFGGLVDYFNEDEGFRYFDTNTELINTFNSISTLDRGKMGNCKKVEAYTWKGLVDEIISACEHLD